MLEAIERVRLRRGGFHHGSGLFAESLRGHCGCSQRCGYTKGMKTAVSIRDEIFKGAERLARKTKRSRSRLFSDALREYLARHTADSVTEAMDRA